MPGWATRKTAEEIRRLVRLGKAREGGQLPSERDLANALQVSRATVRAALRILRDEGERVRYSKRGASGRTTTSPDALSFPKTRMSCNSAACGKQTAKTSSSSARISPVRNSRGFWRRTSPNRCTG